MYISPTYERWLRRYWPVSNENPFRLIFLRFLKVHLVILYICVKPIIYGIGGHGGKIQPFSLHPHLKKGSDAKKILNHIEKEKNLYFKKIFLTQHFRFFFLPIFCALPIIELSCPMVCTKVSNTLIPRLYNCQFWISNRWVSLWIWKGGQFGPIGVSYISRILKDLDVEIKFWIWNENSVFSGLSVNI